MMESLIIFRTILKDKVEDFNSVKIKYLLNVVDDFVNCFDNIDSRPFEFGNNKLDFTDNVNDSDSEILRGLEYC